MVSTGVKDEKLSEPIGYSVFWPLYKTFEYYEDACYIADTPESVRTFKGDLDSSGDEYEILEVSVSDVLNDFAFSNGWYAFERGAFEKFVEVIDALEIDCRMRPEDSSTDYTGEISKVCIQTFDDDSDDDVVLGILEDLAVFDGEYKRESLDAAIEHKDEIIPLLIETIEEVFSAPQEYANNQDYMLLTYAVMLLGHFNETKAHTPIIKLLALPEDTADELLGELIHENIPTILFRTSGGSFDEIKSLALNKSAWVYSKMSALRSMVIAVLEGALDRDETLEFFSSLVLERKDDFPDDFWTFFVRCVYDLYPFELMGSIKELYAEDLIDGFFVRLEDFEIALEEDKDTFLERQRIDKQRHSLDDIHKAMSWWACFNQKKDTPRISRPPVDNFEEPKRKRKSNKKKNRKKKMKKASRKKNRR